MSGIIEIDDMPDLGAVTDTAQFVGEKAGSGLFTATALRSYAEANTLTAAAAAQATADAAQVAATAAQAAADAAQDSVDAKRVLGFRAHKGGVAQAGIPSEVQTHVSWPSLAWGDTGHGFDIATGLWTPPAGLIEWCGWIFLSAGAGGAPNQTYAATVLKNGTNVVLGYGAFNSVSYVSAIPFFGMDRCNGSDVYEVRLFASSLTTSTIAGDPAQTFWCGKVTTG